MIKDALELDRMLAVAQAAGDQSEIDRVRDLIHVRQKGIGFIDMEEAAGPEYSPAPGAKLEWSKMRYPCGDPENGAARRNPIEGCIKCEDKEADSYNDKGVCCICTLAEDSRMRELRNDPEDLAVDKQLACVIIMQAYKSETESLWHWSCLDLLADNMSFSLDYLRKILDSLESDGWFKTNWNRTYKELREQAKQEEQDTIDAV